MAFDFDDCRNVSYRRAADFLIQNEDLRAQCFEWLHEGPQGVNKWNELSRDERKSTGKLGECQFVGCDLSGVAFGNQDLRGSDFRDANLKQANFGGADCRLADFRGADLSEAWLAGGKFLQADFRGARFRGASLHAADYRGAIFSESDLRGVDFSHADLRNVDWSRVTLDGNNLHRVKYDERTIFPAGFFVEPQVMTWKGAVSRELGYRSDCSLVDLLALIPPPPRPKGARGNWGEIEAELGIRFPSDFRRLIEAYGSGEFFGDLWIYNPLTENGRNRIAEELSTLEENRWAGEYLWPIYPEQSGMLPWGGDSNGDCFCWLAKGEPDKWPNAKLGHEEDEPDSDDVNVTTFLFNYACNHYPEMRGGLTFEESVRDHVFLPS